MKIYPEYLEILIEYFKKIPGVGSKTAERYALSLLNMDMQELEEFGKYISNTKKKIKYCHICGHITDGDFCNICSDKCRDAGIILVVEDYKSVFMFEKVGEYKGTYHVLGGLISPIEGINPEELNISSLISRCKKNKNIEVIIALKSSIEGETTSLYLKKILEKYGTKISRLSYGIPVGADIDYLDVLTLERALLDRKELS